jgi:RimJ/RimL family protein N-acetyltransferase
MVFSKDPLEPAGLLRLLPVFTPRLELRLFKPRDADDLYELHRNPRVTRHAGGSKTREESLRSLHRIIERTGGSGFGALAVREIESNTVIGWCGVQPLRGQERYEIIYALKPSKWGIGFATEAASALMLTAFELRHLGIDDICAVAYPQNIRSLAVMERLGMTFERNIYDEGSRRHACIYSVSRRSFLMGIAALQRTYSLSSK